MARRNDTARRRGAVRIDPPSRPLPKTPDNAFRAAEARRVLARDLPDVVYTGRHKPSYARDEKPCIGCAQEAAVQASKPVKARPRDVVQPDRPSVMLDKPRDTCKGKPSEAQSKGGGGKGRPFVPWCGKK